MWGQEQDQEQEQEQEQEVGRTFRFFQFFMLSVTSSPWRNLTVNPAASGGGGEFGQLTVARHPAAKKAQNAECAAARKLMYAAATLRV
jgi:hypothetical protein